MYIGEPLVDQTGSGAKVAEHGRLAVAVASARVRIWFAGTLGACVVLLVLSAYSSGEMSRQALYLCFIFCGLLIVSVLVIQPVSYLEADPVRLVRGVRVFGLLVRLNSRPVDRTGSVIVVEHFRGAPRQRREGWCLGVKLEDGRTAWLGYSRDHAEIEARAKPIRAWLRRCRRG